MVENGPDRLGVELHRLLQLRDRLVHLPSPHGNPGLEDVSLRVLRPVRHQVVRDLRRVFRLSRRHVNLAQLPLGFVMVRVQLDRFLKFLEGRGEVPRLQGGLGELEVEPGIVGPRLHRILVLDHRLLVLLLLRILVPLLCMLRRQFRRSARAGKEKSQHN